MEDLYFPPQQPQPKNPLLPLWLLDQQQQSRNGTFQGGLQEGTMSPELKNMVWMLSEASGIPQAFRAGSAINETVKDPSIPNATNAGVQTGLAAFRPMMALKSALAGYGAAGVTDAARSFAPNATAADPAEIERRLRAMPADQVRALQQQLGIAADGKIGPSTITAAVKADADREAQARASTESTVAIESARAKAEAEANARLKGETQSAQRTQIDEAKRQLMADILAGKTPQEDRSVAGQVYEKLGILTPVLAAILGGGAAKAATGKIGFSKLLSDQSGPGAKAAAKMADEYVVPALGGMELGTTLSYAPTYAEANRRDTTNPEYDAWSKYRVRLPADAANEIALADNKLSGPNAIPRIDPSVTAARDRLRDGGDRLATMGGMALAGMSGGMIKESLPFVGNGVKRLAQGTAETVGALPGNVATGYQRSAGDALTEIGKNALLRQKTAEAQANAIASQRLLAEEQRRLNAGTGGQVQGGQAAPQPQGGTSVQPSGQSQTNGFGQNPSQSPNVTTSNGWIIPDSITSNKTRISKVYADNTSEPLQKYVLDKAKSGISPDAIVRKDVAAELNVPPNRTSAALKNLQEFGAANGLDVSDPKVLRAIAQELKTVPQYMSGKRSKIYGLGGVGVGVGYGAMPGEDQ